MSKYDPLCVRLVAQDGSAWRASFGELEAVLGFSLPKAARTAGWWKTDAATPQARAWTQAGWEIGQADPAGGLVTFRRTAGSPPRPPGDVQSLDAAPEEPAILQRLEATPKWNLALVTGGLVLAAGLGVFAIRGFNRRRG